MDQSNDVQSSQSRGSVTQLLHRLKDGDDDAATELWNRYGPRILGRARRLLAHGGVRVPDAESVAQQVFIEFCCKRPALANRNQFLGWLLNAARCRAIDQLRGEAQLPRLQRLGISCEFDVPEPRTALVSAVIPDSPAARAGLLVNDRICRVCDCGFDDRMEFERLIASHHGPWELLVKRGGEQPRIVVKGLPVRASEVGESRLGQVIDSDSVVGVAAVAGRNSTPMDQAERNERSRKLAHAIDMLDDKHRRACLLYYNIDNSEGVCETWRDVGDRLGVTGTAARLRVLKAIKLLRESLQSMGIVEESEL